MVQFLAHPVYVYRRVTYQSFVVFL